MPKLAETKRGKVPTCGNPWRGFLGQASGGRVEAGGAAAELRTQCARVWGTARYLHKRRGSPLNPMMLEWRANSFFWMES